MTGMMNGRSLNSLGLRILRACEAAARNEGFQTLALMATLPGLLLYERYGFRIIEHTTILLPDGITLATASMERSIRSEAIEPIGESPVSRG